MSIYTQPETSIYDGTRTEAVGAPANVAQSRGAYVALAKDSTNEDLLESFKRTARDLAAKGYSDDEQAVLEAGRREIGDANRRAALDISLMDATPQQRVSAIGSLATTPDTDIISEAFVNQAAQYTAPTLESAAVREVGVGQKIVNNLAKSLLDSTELRSALEQTRMNLALDMSEGYNAGEGLGEVAELVVPFTMQEMYYDVFSDVFPNEDWGQAYALTGEARIRFKELFDSLPQDKKLEAIMAFEESAKKHAGVVFQNGMMAHFMMGEIWGVELDERGADSFDWDRAFQNMASVLDLVAVGGLVSKGGKGVVSRLRGGVGRTIDLVDSANPEHARALREALIREANPEAEEMLGLTVEDAILETFPSFKGAILNGAPDGVVDKLANSLAELRKMEEDAIYGLNYTQEELIEMRDKVANSIMAKDGYFDMSRSVITQDELGDKFIIEAAYGASSDSGFAGVDRAVRHFKDNWEEGMEFTLLAKQGDTFVELSEDMPLEQFYKDYGESEIYYRVRTEYNYDQSIADVDSLLFGDKVVDSSALHSVFNNKWMKDSASLFDRFVNKAINRAGDYSQGLAHGLTNVVEKNLAPLSMESKHRVMNLLQKGSDEEVTFRFSDLAHNYTEPEISAYYSLRALADTQHALDNRRVYNRLKSQGYESVVYNGTAFEGVGKRLEQSYVKGNVPSAYNPVTGQIEQLTPSMIDDIYENGGLILASKFENTVGGERSRFILSDGSVTVRPLNRNPLPYRPGYVTRGYADNYMIKMSVVGKVDGASVPREKTIASAATKVDADKMIEELRHQYPDAELSAHIKRELDDPTVIDDDIDFMFNTGGMVTGRRGELLASKSSKENQLLDPIESLQKHISYTSGRVAYDDLMQTMEARWVNTYGKHFGVDNIQDYKKIASNTTNDKRVHDAKALAEHILAARGVQPENYKKYRSMMLSLAESLETTMGGGQLAKNIGDYLRGFNPVKAIRGLTFNLLLATNPLRQLVLQTNQITMLAGISPKAFVRSAGGLMAFGNAMLTRNTTRWGGARRFGAKVMGTTEDEFEKLFDGFKSSGLPASINAHSFARDAMPEISARISGNLAQRTARRVFNITKTPLRAVRAVGFNAGEWNNLAMTYLMAYDLWRDGNKGKKLTKLAIADIATEARDLALNMTKSGELNYQRGAFSLATQFMSYQHKALLAAFGVNRKFRELTPMQRSGFLAAQVVLYGLDGIPMGILLERLIDAQNYDIPEVPKAIMEGLVYDYMFNSILKAISGEEQEVDFTGDLSPFGGTYSAMSGFFANIMAMSIPDAALGASGSALGRVADAIGMVQFIGTIPDLTSGEKAELMIEQGLQVFGGYNAYVKGHAMRQLNYHLSNRGEPLYRATTTEGWMTTLFGIGPDAEEEYYRVAQEINGAYAPRSNIDKIRSVLLPDEEINAIAKTWYDRMLALYREHNMGDLSSLSDLDRQNFKSMVELENMAIAVLPDDVAFAVRRHIQQHIQDNVNGDGYDALISEVVKRSFEGSVLPSTAEDFLKVLSNPDLNLTAQQRRDVQRAVQMLLGE